jgi:hypothetical protein
MEDLRKEQKRLAAKANYSKAIHEVDGMIRQLSEVKAKVRTDPVSAGMQLGVARQSIKRSFEVANDNLKEVNSGLKGYAKALDKVRGSAA